MGAVISSRGSFGSTIRPSGTAQTSPSNRRARKASSVSSANPRCEPRCSSSSSSNRRSSRNVEARLQTGRDQEPSVRRQAPDEQGERRLLVHASAQVARRHVELVQVGQQRRRHDHSLRGPLRRRPSAGRMSTGTIRPRTPRASARKDPRARHGECVMEATSGRNPMWHLARDGLDKLIRLLAEQGYEVIGPTVRDGAIVLEHVDGVGDLPAGIREDARARDLRADQDRRRPALRLGSRARRREAVPVPAARAARDDLTQRDRRDAPRARARGRQAPRVHRATVLRPARHRGAGPRLPRSGSRRTGAGASGRCSSA